MMARSTKALGFATALTLLGWPQGHDASADGKRSSATSSPSADRVSELKKRGDAAMQSFAYADALAAYTEACSIARDASLTYNRAMALRALGDYPEALREFEAFDESASTELRARVPHLNDLLADVRARVSELHITCNVSGARVLIRGRSVGTTPLYKSLMLNAGTAEIDVSAEDYEPFRETLDLRGQQKLDLNLTLVPRSRDAILVVRSNPSGAAVLIDGANVGISPSESVVSPGMHRVSTRLDGYELADASTVLMPRSRRELDFELERKPGLLEKWWFWTAIGVVVASGVAVGWVLTHPRSSDGGAANSNVAPASLIRF